MAVIKPCENKDCKKQLNAWHNLFWYTELATSTTIAPGLRELANICYQPIPKGVTVKFGKKASDE